MVFTVAKHWSTAGDKAEKCQLFYIIDFKMHIFSHFNISEVGICLTIT